MNVPFFLEGLNHGAITVVYKRQGKKNRHEKPLRDPCSAYDGASLNMSTLWGLAIAGTITAIFQNLSGFPLLRRISTDAFGSKLYTRWPIWSMSVTCIQIGLYGVFTLGWPDCLQLAICNFLGAFFWLINFIVFVYYSKTSKERLHLTFIYAFTLIWALGLPLGLYISPSSAGLASGTKQIILGCFMQAANFSGFLSPVSSLLVAWRTKDTKRVPGMLSWVNLANSIIWVAYGVLLNDGWIWIPNVVGLVLSGAQVFVLLLLLRTAPPSVTGDVAAVTDATSSDVK